MEYQSGVVSPVESVSDGWSLIKDDYWLFFAMTLIAIVILFGAAMLLGLVNNLITMGISTAFGIATQNTGDVGKMSAAIVPQLISMVISIFTNVIVLTISGALFCGIYSAMSRKANTGVVEFGDLFNGFQKIMPCFIVAVVVSLIQFVINVVLLLVGAAVGISAFGVGMLTKNGQINPAVFGGLFLFILAFVVIYIVVNLIISALTAFVYPLIAERDISGGEALMLSVKGGFANIGGIILLMLLMGLMAIGGTLLCFVGVLFVMPIISAALFSAFRKVFGAARDFRRHTPPSPPVFGNQPGY